MDHKHSVEELLNRPDKGINTAQGILSKIFRQLLWELNITPIKFNKLLSQYLNDPRNRVSRTPRGRSSTRGNLSKELRKDKMTWLNFEKGIRFLNPIKAEFSIKLTWRGNKVTEHSIVVLDRLEEKEKEKN